MQSIFSQLGLTLTHLRKLGKGAFGEVTLCRVVETGELVALKRIYIRQASEGIPDNVVREIKSLQAVEHPNVVMLKDVQTKGSSIVLVMEYCCMDLQRVLRTLTQCLPEELVKSMMQQVLLGVKAIHDAGILHRDLKPSNLLINSEGWVKLADFGLARPIDTEAKRPEYTHTVATRWYRAPELLYGARCYSFAVDMWAVGCIFAEIIGLGPLLPGENDIDQLAKTISTLGSIEPHWPGVEEMPDWGKVTFPTSEGTPLSTLLPAASPLAVDLIAQMLRYNPDERISATDALLDPYFFVQPHPASISAVGELIHRVMREADEEEALYTLQKPANDQNTRMEQASF